MNKNIMIVLAGGFLIAILVAVLVQMSLSGPKEQPAEQNKTQILVATQDLKIGRELRDGDTKWQNWPEDNLFMGAVVREDDEDPMEGISGRLTQAFSQGQPIHSQGVMQGVSGNFMAANLKEGMRAMAISVKAENIAGGFIGPGDFVDVIVTYQVRVRERDNPLVQAMIDEYASETILSHVRVVAVDQQAERAEEEAKVGRTVTLEVNAKGAEKLALGAEMGDITLALRRIGDESSAVSGELTTDVSVSRVLKNLAAVQGGGEVGSVRVFNGNARNDVRVRQNLDDLIEPENLGGNNE